jgi:TPR repeat protein
VIVPWIRSAPTDQQYSGDLGTLAGRLRRSAEQGNAGAQYALSRLVGANVSLNRTGLNADDLFRRAADPGKDRRAMLALGAMTGKIPAEERRGWVMKSARAGLAPAQVLVALDAWAEQTEAGHARAHHWLELAARSCGRRQVITQPRRAKAHEL